MAGVEMAITTRYAKTAEGYVAYQVWGEGPPDLVFVCDWRSNLDVMWEEPRLSAFLRRLGSFSRVLAFDKRGTGLSDPVPFGAVPTLEQWMDDVRTVMDAADSDHAVLYGDAEGGPMAMLFAATFPQRTSALVLSNTFARLLRDDSSPWGIPPDRVPIFLDRFEQGWGTGDALRLVSPDHADDSSFRSWYARYERLSLSPGFAAAAYRSIFDIDLRPVLPSIQVPTLVLHSERNQHIRVGHGRYLAETIPQARLVTFPTREHVFFLIDSDTMAGAIEEFVTGARRGPEPHRVLATVLFTDVVGSTEHATRLGDRRWRDLLATHDALVRSELERFRGREVKLTGDGFLATFDGPGRAARCASAIRDSIGTVGIDVRAGLHTGELELRGDDVAGIAVHLAQRISSVAHPGEVLVSRTVVDLVAGSGIAFEDRGEHVLKGVPGAWRLFSVTR
jgi:class 3 adenylate cyclase